MKYIFKNISIFLFSLIYSFLAYGLVSFLPKNILKVIPMIVWFLIIDLLFVVILYFLYKKELKEEWIIFKSNWKKMIEDNLPYWILGIVLMSILSVVVETIISKDMPENEKIVRELLKNFPVYTLISSVLIAPFTEEILYRKVFKNIFKNKYIFMAMSGITFGAAHVIFSYETIADFLYILPYGALGVVFAYMYEKTKTIFTPIVFHLSHNFIMTTIALISAFASSLMR